MFKTVQQKYADREDKENEPEIEESQYGASREVEDGRTAKGAYSRNPLLGGLIRPVYTPADEQKTGVPPQERKTMWRRVQDDYEDNEEVILDGGVYGGGSLADPDRREGADERP